MLKRKQQLAIDKMKSSQNVFLTGEGGTGKSYVLNTFINYCENKGLNCIICAPTGIAAININGVTIHRTFNIPMKPLIEPVKSIPLALKDADVIIIDEISMCRVDVFDYVAQSLIALNKFRRKNNKKDIQVIVVGDFFQLPPVIKDDDRIILEQYKYNNNLGRGFAFQSSYWKLFNFVTIQLDEVVRQTDRDFIINLNGIRRGNINNINYFNQMCSKHEITNTISIYGTNSAVNKKNSIEYNKIKEKEYIYKADIEGNVADSDKVVPDELHLKVGCRVMMVVNDAAGLYQNGTLGKIKKLEKDKIVVTKDDGCDISIYKYTWDIHDYKVVKKDNKVKAEINTIGTYTQYPLKLAYAATIHSSQGQTFDSMNLDPYCWDCGQLYVALSRVRKIENLHLIQPIRPMYLKASNDVKDFYTNL